MEIKEDFAHESNYWMISKERPADFQGICFHITGGFYSLDWFKNPQSNNSANYLINANGEIIRNVPIEAIAWTSNPKPENRKTIPFFHNFKDYKSLNQTLQSIEMECMEGETLTPEQKKALIWLVPEIHGMFEIPLERRRWFRHSDLDANKRDPGISYDIDKLFAIVSKPKKTKNSYDRCAEYLRKGMTIRIAAEKSRIGERELRKRLLIARKALNDKTELTDDIKQSIRLLDALNEFKITQLTALNDLDATALINWHKYAQENAYYDIEEEPITNKERYEDYLNE